METILKFDRVILTKELNDKIKKVGDVFEIANILDNSFLLREAKSRVAVGVVSLLQKKVLKDGLIGFKLLVLMGKVMHCIEPIEKEFK